MDRTEFKIIRKQLKLTQRQLAERLNRNYRTVQRYEKGDWKVSVEVAGLMRGYKKITIKIRGNHD